MGSIWVTGDIHGDPTRLNMEAFQEQEEMSRDDFIIVLGDFGLVWDGSASEKYWLDWLEKKPFSVLFIDGNHENFDMLGEFPIVSFHGGKAHRIRGNIYHLMRGYVFQILGKKLFAFGGASSHDIDDGILDPADFKDTRTLTRKAKAWRQAGKMFRIRGKSWWPEELPSKDEMQRGRQSLEAVGNAVDFVLTHCAPGQVAALVGYRESDRLTQYLDNLLLDGLEFTRWLFGHYHSNRQIMCKFLLLYEQIVRIA